MRVLPNVKSTLESISSKNIDPIEMTFKELGFEKESRISQKQLRRSDASQRLSRPAVVTYNGYVYSDPFSGSRLAGRRRADIYRDMEKLRVISDGINEHQRQMGKTTLNFTEIEDSDAAVSARDLFDELLLKGLIDLEKANKWLTTARFYGHCFLEWVIDPTSGVPTRIYYIPQHSIEKIELDEDGNVLWIEQNIRGKNNAAPRRIDREKLIYLVNDERTDDPRGRGILDDIAEECLNLLSLKKIEHLAHVFDTAGFLKGRWPENELTGEVENEAFSESDVNDKMNPMMQFMKTAVRAEMRPAILMDSETYETTDGTGRPSNIYKYDIIREKGDAAGLTPIYNTIRRIENSIAKSMNLEWKNLGDDGAGATDLIREKIREWRAVGDEQLKVNIRTLVRDYLPYVAMYNNIAQELIPQLNFSSLQQISTEQVNMAVDRIASAIEKGTFNPLDPMWEHLRSINGIPQLPDEEKAEQVRIFEAQRLASMNAIQNPIEDNEEEEDANSNG